MKLALFAYGFSEQGEDFAVNKEGVCLTSDTCQKPTVADPTRNGNCLFGLKSKG